MGKMGLGEGGQLGNLHYRHVEDHDGGFAKQLTAMLTMALQTN
jgi:hypothetical protein